LPRIGKLVRKRTLQSRLPGNRGMAPLSSESYAKRKRKKSRKPVRDGTYTGQMLRSLTGKVDNKRRARLYFGGSRKTNPTSAWRETKTGRRTRKYLYNQVVADMFALINAFGEREPRTTKNPYHEFMGADKVIEKLVTATYEKMVLWSGLDKLPPDPKLEAIFRR
jgi:hypothetical protein